MSLAEQLREQMLTDATPDPVAVEEIAHIRKILMSRAERCFKEAIIATFKDGQKERLGVVSLTITGFVISGPIASIYAYFRNEGIELVFSKTQSSIISAGQEPLIVLVASW